MANKETLDIDKRATNLFIKEKRSVSEIEKILFEEGFDSEVIGEVVNRIKGLEMERAKNVILAGILFIVFGLFFYGVRVYNGSNYGGGIDYVGLIAIVYGVYKIIKGYNKSRTIKQYND